MAVANTHDSFEDIYKTMAIFAFAEEAFEYLMQKALVYDPTADSTGEQSTEFPDMSKYAVFNHNIGKAILVLAHNFREEHTKIFNDAGDQLRDVSYFQALAIEHDPTRYQDYFDGFLRWVAFVFNMTLFCFYEGYDYTQIGQKCLERIPDIARFYAGGEWQMLEKCAEEIACYYDGLSEDITTGLLKLGEKDSLLKYIERLQVRDENYIPTTGFNRIRELKYFLRVKESFLSKFEVVSLIDLNRITVGYKVIIKDESLVQSNNSQHVSPKVSDVPTGQEPDENECFGINKNHESKIIKKESLPDDVIEKPISSECENTRNVLTCSDVPANISSEDLPWEVDDRKSVFLVSERYIGREDTRLHINGHERWKYKHAIKIHSPSKESKKLVKNMFEVVKANIENKNYIKVTNEIIAICPPGCDLKDDDTRVVVLDTSSDDEETPGKLRPKQWEVMLASVGVYNRIKKKSRGHIAAAQRLQRKATTTECDESALAKNTGTIPKVKKFTLPKDGASEVEQDLRNERGLARNTGALPKVNKFTLPKDGASEVEQNLRDERALARNTGAIPKVKKFTLPKDGASEVEQYLRDERAIAKNTGAVPKVKKFTLPKDGASEVEQDLRDERALAKNTGSIPKVKKFTLPKDGASDVKQDLSADSVSDTSPGFRSR